MCLLGDYSYDTINVVFSSNFIMYPLAPTCFLFDWGETKNSSWDVIAPLFNKNSKRLQLWGSDDDCFGRNSTLEYIRFRNSQIRWRALDFENPPIEVKYPFSRSTGFIHSRDSSQYVKMLIQTLLVKTNISTCFQNSFIILLQASIPNNMV